MSVPIESRDFRLAYREAVTTVADDPGLRFRLPASSDWISMRGYLAACETLYVEALGMLRGVGLAAWPAPVLDAGGSFGAFAAALRSLGVAVADGPASDAPAELAIGLALHGQTDPVATLVTRSGRLLNPAGRLVLAVPSSGHWPRRLAELRGRQPATSGDEAVALGMPSYNRRRLRALLAQGGFGPARIRARDYSPIAVGGPLRQTAASAAKLVAPRHREVWLALASRDGAA